MWTSSKQWRWLQRVQVFGRWTPSIVGWGWVHHLGPLDSDAFTSSLFIHLFDLCFIIWRSKQLGERDTLLPCWPAKWAMAHYMVVGWVGIAGLQWTGRAETDKAHTSRIQPHAGKAWLLKRICEPPNIPNKQNFILSSTTWSSQSEFYPQASFALESVYTILTNSKKHVHSFSFPVN